MVPTIQVRTVVKISRDAALYNVSYAYTLPLRLVKETMSWPARLTPATSMPVHGYRTGFRGSLLAADDAVGAELHCGCQSQQHPGALG